MAIGLNLVLKYVVPSYLSPHASSVSASSLPAYYHPKFTIINGSPSKGTH